VVDPGRGTLKSSQVWKLFHLLFARPTNLQSRRQRLEESLGDIYTRTEATVAPVVIPRIIRPYSVRSTGDVA
jgi:hypothetical protein